MTTQEVANRLVELCRIGKWDQAQTELFAENAVSIEPEGQQFPAVTAGKEAIKAKGERWASMVEEFHGAEVSEPLVSGDQFSVGWSMDITYKGGPRTTSKEIGVFEVREGKITKEQFFYPVNPAPAE